MSRGKLRMLIRVLVVCGSILFIGGIGLGSYLIIGYSKASDLTSAFTFHGHFEFGQSGGSEFHPLVLRVSSPIISESETDVLTVDFDYIGSPSSPVTVTLCAPGFNPSEVERIMPFSQNVILTWVLSPTKPGTFKVAVQTVIPSQHFTDTGYIGITVTNILGLSPWQIQLLSYVGSFLGPLLTAAWWYDKWQERKRRKSDEASLASTTKSPKPHHRARQKR